MIKPKGAFGNLACGATTVSNLGDPDQDPKEMIISMLTGMSYRYTYYVMADAQPKRLVKNTSGVKLKKYIEDNELGDMIETQGRHFSDVNGENYIKIYVWRPDYAGVKFKQWVKDNKAPVVKPMGGY